MSISFYEKLIQAKISGNPLSENLVMFLNGLNRRGDYIYFIEGKNGKLLVKPFQFFPPRWHDLQFFDWEGSSLPMDMIKDKEKFIAIKFIKENHIALVFFHYPVNN